MDEVEAGATDPKEASRYIFALIRNAKFSPAANHLGDPNFHYINAGEFVVALKTLAWLLTSAPPDIRSLSLGLLGNVGAHPAPSAG
jgi:hypothetical protein